MLMLIPDTWTGVDRPIGLLSGNRFMIMSSTASVYAIQRAGVPLATVTLDDYIRVMKKFPGPDGKPTEPIPSQYANLGL